jgi:hypothetical protein
MAGIKTYIKGTLATVLLATLFSACLTAPEFPNEPEISFNDIAFSKGATEFDQDSLILTINFRDGDGDLGLRPDGQDTKEPYHDIWFFTKDDGSLVTLADRQLPGYDTLLPPYEFPYTCINWNQIIDSDTLYTEPNEFFNNIYVTFFVKKNGEYIEFDFLELFKPQCNSVTFNGRYPLLNDPNRDRPLEGKLKYKMKSALWELTFRLDTMKLDVYIYDRALNKSNVISTPDFVLKNITTGG